MATKLVRQTLYQFGSTVNGASEVGVYGSGAAGSPVYTSSITLMQSLAAWNRGWAAETIANNRPFLEDMNAVDCVFGYQLSYLMQQGIAEFDTSGNSNYFLNSISQYLGGIYQVINDNGGAGISATLPTNATYWKQLLPVTGILGAWTAKTIGTIYQATTDGFVIASYNSSSSSANTLELISDSNSTPSTVRAISETNFPSSGVGITGTFVSSPIKKGDYYQVTATADGTPSGTMFFISLGS